MTRQRTATLGQTPGEKTLHTLKTADLIRTWRQDFSMDVSALFEGIDRMEMVEASNTGLIRFEPPVLGDAQFYDALRRFDWYHPASKEEFLTAAALVQPGDRVIDVGAGTGAFAAHMPDGVYLGLETDKAAAQGCRHRGLDVRPLSMAEHLASASFEPADLATAFQVLEHVADPGKFLMEIASLVRPEGQVVIGVPDTDSYLPNLPDIVLNAPPHHVTWWRETSLTAYLEAAGLEVVTIHRYAVEPWEYQLWWMARIAAMARPAGVPPFGRRLRARKVISFILSWGLQKVPIPAAARGSTLVAIARKPGR